jgi:hypothetical protein
MPVWRRKKVVNQNHNTNVRVEYHWLEGQIDRLPALMVDLVCRRMAVIATPAGNLAALAANLVWSKSPPRFKARDRSQPAD